MSLSRLFRFLALAVLVAVPAHAADDAGKRPENVVGVLKAHKELSQFADMVASSGVEPDLVVKGASLTLFAPNNAAMGKIPSDVTKRIKADKGELKKFVQYHVISGSQVFLANIQNRRASPSSLSGEMLAFDGTGKEPKINEATLVTPDLVSQNGVVQVVDAVLIPPSLKAPKVEIPEAERMAAQPPAGAEPAPAAPVEAKPAPEKKGFWKKMFGG